MTKNKKAEEIEKLMKDYFSTPSSSLKDKANRMAFANNLVAPLRRSIDYNSIGRRSFLVSEMIVCEVCHGYMTSENEHKKNIKLCNESKVKVIMEE